MTKKRSFWDKFWRDNNGKIVIGQKPNVFFGAWILLTVFSFFVATGPGNLLFQTGKLSLFIWAILEITRGVNYFRKLYGLVVLGLICRSVL